MACSPAQLEANRKNAQLHSTGPRTAEGKAISRRNSLKTGLTGRGIVLPTEDAEEVDRRLEALEADLAPQSELARELVYRVAVLTTRLRRSAEHEARAIAHRMRKAGEDFDDARLAEVEHLMSWIASEPATHARRLRRSPEGISRLIREIEALRSDLARPGSYRWGYEHSERLHHLLGLRSADVPATRVRALTDAIAGKFQLLDEADGPGLEVLDRRVWAIGALVYFMDDEIAELKALLQAFDREGLELDRAESAARAMFDPSKEAVLARKYEAATERGLYRALDELREIQPEAHEKQGVAAESPEELGSFLPQPEAVEDESANADPIPVEVALAIPGPAPKRRPGPATPRNRRERRRSKRS